jgi:predicted membrane protein
MGKLLLGILGLVAAFILIMFVLAIVHVLFLYAFFIVLIAIAAFAMFKVGRWSGRRRRSGEN